MNVPVAVSNIVVGLFAEECIEAEAHLQSICEHFTALSQGAVTVPSKFDSETFPASHGKMAQFTYNSFGAFKEVQSPERQLP